MPYTNSSTAFLRSFVSSITRSCSAISNSSVTNCSMTAAGRPPTVDDTGRSVFLIFFFFSGTGAGAASAASPAAAASPSPIAASPSAAAAAAGAGTATTGASSSISSTACADSTLTRPFRFRRTFTLILVLESLASGSTTRLADGAGTGPMSKVPTDSAAPGASSCGVVYLACSVKVSLRKKVIILDDGTGLLRSNSSMSLTSPPSPTQLKDTGYGKVSTTSNSRTLNCGLSMAPCSAHPRATHSDAFSVRPGTMPKNASSCAGMKGMREPLPTSSTALMSAGTRPASDMAVVTGPMSLASRPWDSSSILSRVMDDFTSFSSMMHSMAMFASGLALRIFFIFSMAIIRRRDARALVLMSSFCFSMNSAQKCPNMAWSKARPPRLRSNPVASTLSWLLVNRTTHTCSAECPTSTNTTLVGSSPNSAVLKMPYASAVAVVSFIRRITFSPAMAEASSMARRCASLKNTGTDTTASVTLAPWSFSAMFLRSDITMATRRSGVNVHFLPRYCTVTKISSLGPCATGNMKLGMSACTSGSLYLSPIRRLSSMIVSLGCMLILSAAAHPMNRCFSPKLIMEGVSRLDSSLSTTSMPLRRARATMLLAFPKSIPTTLIFTVGGARGALLLATTGTDEDDKRGRRPAARRW
mmetsp:Transcript_355/g.806  ORF Transcript_355/g.806 Transcript_355/m.806 type:complete len:643 (+) Transcript_355:899-2827(+)